MSLKTDRVVRGFISLTDAERREVVAVFNRYLDADERERKDLHETYVTRAAKPIGPTNDGGCPCCGR